MSIFKKLSFVLAALVLLAVPAYLAGAVDMVERNIPRDLERHVVIVTKDGKKHSFDVELALDKEQQANGLMYVTQMPMGSGMLFIFKAVQERAFWMKNTLIPLDMIFIEGDGRIQHVHSMAKPQDTAHITSGKPSKAVLEINGGVADRLGIEAGDVVYHSAFNNTHLSP